MRISFSFLYCLVLTLVSSASPVSAYVCETVILVSSNNHSPMVTAIQESLLAKPNAKFKLAKIVSEEVSQNQYFAQFPHPCLIVTVGAQALQAVLKAPPSLPILSTFTRRQIFQHLVKDSAYKVGEQGYPISAIFVDQPLSRELNLLRILLPEKAQSPIGVLWGPHSFSQRERLQELVKKNNLQLTSVYLNNGENPVTALDTLMNEVKVILAVPDEFVYNPRTSRGILLSALHRRMPLIGYSQSYVSNGALAAVYSTPRQLANQTVTEILHFIEKEGKLSPPQSPTQFKVAVNHQVARSLKLTLIHENLIEQRMMRAEQQVGKQ